MTEVQCSVFGNTQLDFILNNIKNNKKKIKNVEKSVIIDNIALQIK